VCVWMCVCGGCVCVDVCVCVCGCVCVRVSIRTKSSRCYEELQLLERA